MRIYLPETMAEEDVQKYIAEEMDKTGLKYDFKVLSEERGIRGSDIYLIFFSIVAVIAGFLTAFKI